MIRPRTVVYAALLALCLAAPVRAATYTVDFIIDAFRDDDGTVTGRLYFDDISDGARNATGIEVITAPGPASLLGPYTITTFAPSFSFSGLLVTMQQEFQAAKTPSDPNDPVLNFRASSSSFHGLGSLTDFATSTPISVDGVLTLYEPQAVNDVAPVPLPASLPLLLAALAGMMPWRRLRVRTRAKGGKHLHHPTLADRHRMRPTMISATKILGSAFLVLGLSAPARAATYMVTFSVPAFDTPSLVGQLYFPNRFGNQVPTKLIVTVAPGGSAYLGEYVFDARGAVFDLEKDYVQVIQEGGAGKVGNGSVFLDFIPTVLIRLLDLSNPSPNIVNDAAAFSTPVEVDQTPSPVPLPAALPLLLAALGGLAALRRYRARQGATS